MAQASLAEFANAAHAGDQAMVDQLTVRPGEPDPNRVVVASGRVSMDDTSMGDGANVSEPKPGQQVAKSPGFAKNNDLDFVRRMFAEMGPLESLGYDDDNESLAMNFTCDASAPPDCVEHFYVTFDNKHGTTRVDAMIAFRNTPEWKALWAPYWKGMQPAPPSATLQTALARARGGAGE